MPEQICAWSHSHEIGKLHWEKEKFLETDIYGGLVQVDHVFIGSHFLW